MSRIGSSPRRRCLGSGMAAIVVAMLGTGIAHAHHKAGHHIPPGQMKKLYDPGLVVPAEVEFVCLVTTEVAGDPFAPVIYTQWLPRPEAEAEANRGRSLVVYHPDLDSEQECAGF